jgi:peptidyl-prolyl cis-trans isomerase-like protein 2
MGKKRHSQDKLWITYKELVEDWGGKKEGANTSGLPIKQLPFYCCSLSFMPFQDPVCLQDGTIFDIVNILPYIKKYKKNPITGRPLKATELIKLNFHKNQDNEYHCPITYKVFTENSKIIAIKETGNVYSYEAYDELNKKPKNYKDLLTNTPFEPNNIIVIQDPMKSGERLIKDFHFIQEGEDIDFIKNPGTEKEGSEHFVNLPSTYIKLIKEYEKNDPIKLLGQQEDEFSKKFRLETDEFEKNISKLDKELDSINSLSAFKKYFRISPLAYINYIRKRDKPQHERFTEGKTSSGLTSTAYDPTSKNKKRNLTDDELRSTYYNVVKSKQAKGFIRLNTNYGSLNIMLHCDLTPKTCENFIELCEYGYYNNTIFHRLIKGFVIQGGDPTGTGTGGRSIFGKSFEDELNPKLRHLSRGLLSMANSGKGTNGSQFFITFGPAMHLDNKHSIFGEVVGNVKLLDEWEGIGADDKDRPLKEVKIMSVDVYTNPFRDVISDILIKEFTENYMKTNSEIEKEKRIEERLKNVSSDSTEVGKYLGKKRMQAFNQNDPYIYEKPKRDKGGFDFSNW